MKNQNEKRKIVITANDFWRLLGVIFVVAGYFVEHEKNFEASFGEFSFRGEALAVLGIALIFVPVFLRSRNAK